MHYLPRNESNSREVSRTVKNSQEHSSQIQEIMNGSSESKNKTDHSIRNAKMSLNMLTVRNFYGWNRRTEEMPKLEDEKLEFS